MEKKIKNLLKLMDENSIEAYMIGPSTDLRFLIGLSTFVCERFQAFFLLNNGDFFYISPQVYYEEVNNILDKSKVFMWKDREGFVGILKDTINRYNLKDKRIAINNTISAVNLIDIENICNCKFINGQKLLENLRIIKSEKEVKKLKKAAKLADEIMRKTINYIKPGITENDIKEKIKTIITKLETEGVSFEPIVSSGPNSSKPHYNKGERTIQKKDIIILDLGCVYKGYCSDMSRTVFVGDISIKEKKVYNIVKKAYQSAEDIVKEGITAEDVDQKARSIIEKAGYGDYFINRTGHGIGVSVHEAPFIKTGNKIKLKKGMAFSIEPGIYIPGEFGIRIEDIVIVTEDGKKILNKYPNEIIII